MSNYARLPQIPEEPAPEKEEEQIFKKPDVEDLKPPAKELTEAEQKKKSLKEHLARCRVKSIETRKAKAEEKKKNKKPRGRPKKVKDPSPLVEEFKPNVNLEVKEEYDETTHRINEVVEEPKEVVEQIKEVVEETKQNYSMDLDYEKLADMVAGRLKPKENKPPAPAPAQQQPVVNNQQQVGNFLSSYADMVRQQERAKIVEEKKQRQQENINNATRNYYKKLPPVSLIQSDNAWDNLFNPK